MHLHGINADYGSDPVIQVQAIFQLASLPRSKLKLPGFLESPLIYVQPFSITATLDDQPHTQLWMLRHIFSGSVHTRLILPLTEITQAVDLVPVFRASIDHTVTAATCQEVYDEFYLNQYMDKETFNTLYEPIDTNGPDDELYY